MLNVSLLFQVWREAASAAGYDIRTAEKFEEVMKEFDEIVGYKYLKGMHINDSKSDLCSRLDR